MGAGGKTTALRQLARELAAAGCSVIATMITGMRARDLEGLGATVMDGDDDLLAGRLRTALARGGMAAARAPGHEGKVVGLPPATVDALRRGRLADHVLVEADGSPGRRFRVFAVALLNKALGRDVERRLPACRDWSETAAGDCCDKPDAIFVASLRHGRILRVWSSEDVR